MRHVSIGTTPVSHLALGGASWSLSDKPDVDGAIATIHAAIDHGVTLLDTARAYTTVDHPSHNEWLIAKALATHPAGGSVFVATKGGHFRGGPAEFPEFRRIADNRGLTIQQVVVAWLTSTTVGLIPIVGTGRPAHVVQLAEAVTIELTGPELDSLQLKSDSR